MQHGISVLARWDREAKVWLVTSDDVPGLIVEAETLPAAINEVHLVLPDLLELSADDR